MTLDQEQIDMLEELADLEDRVKTTPNFSDIEYKRYHYIITYLSNILPLKSYHEVSKFR